MSVYEDLAARYKAAFRMLCTALAGERALSAAAGLPAGSHRQWSRAHEFAAGFSKDAKTEFLRFHTDLLANASAHVRYRCDVRLNGVLMELLRLTQDVVKQNNRQAAFGALNPLNALDGRIGAGALGQLAQRRLANPSFKVRDSAGREWDGEALVWTLVRDYAYQTYIDARLDEAAHEGREYVELTHPNPDHPEYGRLMPLDDWALRDEIFHINSRLDIADAAVQT